MYFALFITLLTFGLMEVKAWLMHKYVLHGFLWKLHKSHHSPKKGRFEWNDLFFVYYGILATLCFYFGAEQHDYRFWIGTGISVYGLSYFIVHDLYIHRRLKFFGKTDSVYLKALNLAHKVRHKTHGRDGSQAFGMFWVSPGFLKIAKQKLKPERT